MIRFLAIILSCPFILSAQFGELSTTDDGGHLYFSSTLRVKGLTASRSEYRIYRVIENGVIQPFAERGSLAFQFGGTSNDGAVSPQVSGDGQTVGLTLADICDPCDSAAVTGGEWRAEIRGRNAAILGAGSLVMSRNARWALVNPRQTGIRGQDDSPQSTLINLDTGERSSVPPPLQFVTRPLASDGTLLIQNPAAPGQPSSIGLWRAGVVTPLDSVGAGSIWGLTDNGGALLYTSREIQTDPVGMRLRLMKRNLTTQKDVEIFSGSAGEFPQFMGVSNDGRFVLYRVTTASPAGPAFIADTASGRNTRLVLADGEAVADGTLSGSANAAFLVTTTGRIARVDLASGAVRDMVPPTPFIRNAQFSPGSMTRLEGTLPHSLSALTGNILMNNVAAPVLLVTDTEIRVQAPWELGSQWEFPLRVALSGDTPFEQNELVHTMPMSMRFEGKPSSGVGLPGVAIKADWSGLLTADPQPGEMFHMYLTGLGMVQGTVVTGVPTPTGAVLPIQGSITCEFAPYTKYADTVFAGLAPGMIGIYQVTFRMPDGPAPGHLSGGQCNLQSSTGGGNVSWAHIEAANP